MLQRRLLNTSLLIQEQPKFIFSYSPCPYLLIAFRLNSIFCQPQIISNLLVLGYQCPSISHQSGAAAFSDSLGRFLRVDSETWKQCRVIRLFHCTGRADKWQSTAVDSILCVGLLDCRICYNFHSLESESNYFRLWLSFTNSFTWGWIKNAALVQQARLRLLWLSMTHAFSLLRSSGITAMSCFTFFVFH